MGGIQYVYWPGTTTRLTPWMLYCLKRLDADLQRLFGVRLLLDSSNTQRGIRTYQEQVDLFLSRYRVQAFGKGPYGDARWWKGKRYVRHSGLGTVAQPGTSNHEIQKNYYGAVDLADSGGPGIGTAGSIRSNWLKANAAKYGLEPEGFKFKEAWHYRVPNIFRAVPAGTVTPPKPSVPKPALPILKEIAKMDTVTHVYLKTNAGTSWYLLGASIPNGGARSTRSQETANAWAVLYGSAKNLKTQDALTTVLRETKALHESWFAQQLKINGK